MKPFQFSLTRILWLMLVCAVLAWLLRWIEAPGIVQIPVLAYLLVLALYTVVRLPFVVADLTGRSQRWSESRRKRANLRAWIEEKRRIAIRERQAVPKDEDQ